MAYHTETIKQTNMCGNRSISSPGRRQLLLSTAMRRKLSGFGHVCRHDMLPKIILQRTVDSSRRRGRFHKSWKGDSKEWTGQSMSSMLRIADNRGPWVVMGGSQITSGEDESVNDILFSRAQCAD